MVLRPSSVAVTFTLSAATCCLRLNIFLRSAFHAFHRIFFSPPSDVRSFFPQPGTMVRDVVGALDAGELSQRLPHVYVQSPRAWGLDLPLDVGPPAITLAQVFPISEAEYQTWRRLGVDRFVG